MNCGPMTDPALDLTEDAFLGGQLRLRQLKSGHRAGHDAVLLAAATSARSGDRVADLGAGVGVAGLAVARRVAGVDLVMVEIDPVLADLARANAGANAIAAEIIVLDVEADAGAFAAAGLGPDSVDAVLMNPPFNDPARQNVSPDAARALAHAAAPQMLEHWIAAASRALKPAGVLTLIWRAEALLHVLAVLEREFGGVTVLPVYPRPDAAAIRILVRAVRARSPLMLLPGLVLNDAAGRPSAEAEEILRGGAVLPLANL